MQQTIEEQIIICERCKYSTHEWSTTNTDRGNWVELNLVCTLKECNRSDN